MSWKARAFLGLTIVTGFAVMLVGLIAWSGRFEWFSLLMLSSATVVASMLKIRLPGIPGTMSVNFLFILLSCSEKNRGEVVVLAFLAALVQTYWHARVPPKPIQVLFNVGEMQLAAGMTYVVMEGTAFLGLDLPVRLIAGTLAFFVANTLPIAGIIALTKTGSIFRIWKDCYFWSLPNYLVGASIAWVIQALKHYIDWVGILVLLPAMYFIYYYYRMYLGRLEDGKLHAEEMANLHLRTIQTLALAVEAKDQTTHDHLHRVEVYALEIGKLLQLPQEQMQALRAAALLHDIGKLAIPEHIISKPGKLTPEEFEKMKTHTVVGAELVERVGFPYPVAPMVLSHHEKWDGSGYPHGIKGEEIPIGARILTVVDVFDALTSERQYRRAIPPQEALEYVRQNEGKAFDPAVAQLLREHYHEIEALVSSTETRLSKLSTNIKIEKGDAPAAGFQSTEGLIADRLGGMDALSSIAAARQEAQMLFELSQSLGSSLSMEENLSVAAMRLRRIIPFDAIAVYLRRGDRLHPVYVSGEDFRLFSSLEIPVGEGLSGWVVENRRPITNGNPSVEPGYLNDPTKFSKLQSALSTPLEAVESVIGALTLYHAQRDAFSADHLRILLAAGPKVALTMENALKYHQAESSATTDYLTGLPNARSLFLHLDAELSRSRRSGQPVALIVCDLDGFKQVNDRFGHIEGNRVLETVGRGLRERCREYDYVARMGGDEFVLVLPGAEESALEARIEELQRTVEQAGIEVCGEALLSMSAGCTFFPADGMDAEALLAEADRRMYKNKKARKAIPATETSFEQALVGLSQALDEPQPVVP